MTRGFSASAHPASMTPPMTSNRMKTSTARCFLACLAAATLAACGEVEVRVLVRSSLAEAELAEIATLSATILHDGAPLARVEQPYDGAPLVLPEVDWTRGVALHVTGRRASGTIKAFGSVAPRLPEAPVDCCVALCLCTAADHAAGACTCGHDDCNDDCAP